MRLLNLGRVPWEDSQLIYHALGELGREALVLVSPDSPYLCLGFHQNPGLELDLDFCRENNIPVFRRDLGGGAVYLDSDQYFYQLILHKNNPAVSRSRAAFYQKYLQPVINVYRRIGIKARYMPINDVVVENRKISGTGAAEIGECVVFVGSLIYDFNYEIMSRALQAPDDKFRNRVHQTMTENLTFIRRELGEQAAGQWTESDLNHLLVEEFEKLLGPLKPSGIDDELTTKMELMRRRYLNDRWFYRKGKRKTPGRKVKIRAGLDVLHKTHQSPGGLIRADYSLLGDKFEKVELTGDFFCPSREALGKLETGLHGQQVGNIAEYIRNFYVDHNFKTPGVEPDDWVKVLSG